MQIQEACFASSLYSNRLRCLTARHPLSSTLVRTAHHKLQGTHLSTALAAAGKQVTARRIESVDAEICLQAIKSHCSQIDGELIVSFTAAWCGPCKLVVKELEKVLNRRPALRVLSMDIEAEPNKKLCGELGIKALPTVLFIGRDPKKPTIASQGQMVAKIAEDILVNRIHLSGADLSKRLVL